MAGGIFGALTGSPGQTAYKNNLATINTGLGQQTTALGDNYTQANNYLMGQGLSALQAGYGAGGQLLATGYGNQRTDINQGAQTGIGQLGQYYGQAADAITGNYGSALSALGSGYAQGNSDLTSNYGQAANALTSNYGQAKTDLGNQYAQTQGYLGQATASYQPLINQTAGSVGQYENAIGANGAAGNAAATAAFQAAPGYQYQQDQALGAVQRSAAARGGLAGGNATADILNTATGLANQSYQQYVNNLQNSTGLYTTGLAGQAQGLQAQANASQNYGTQLSGVDTSLGNALASNSQSLGNALNSNDTALGTGQASIYGNQASALGSLYQNQGSTLNSSQASLGTNLGTADANLGTGQSALSVGQGTGTLGVYGQVGSNLTSLGNQESGAIQNATNQYVAANNALAKSQTDASSNLLGSLAGLGQSFIDGGGISGIKKLFS